MKKNVVNDNGSGGFTLLEVILSIAILGIITIPLMNYFTDSLRFSAMTAKRQKATLLAQETIESLKSEDKLIKRTADAAGELYYWVTPLAGKNETLESGDAYEVVDATGFDMNNGTTASGQPLILKKWYAATDAHDYDVYLSLATDLDANVVARPVIYGVDDTKNVMIVERDQEQEALMYFLALNTSYVTNHLGTTSPSEAPSESPDATATPSPDATSTPSPGATPTPSPDVEVLPLETIDNVRKLLQREIFIKIGKETVAPNYYTVQVYYQYSCPKVTNKDEEIFTTSNLMDTRIQKLESIYLLFNMVDPEKDVVHIIWDTDMPASEKVAPEFVLVCQNLDQLKGTEGATPAPDPAGSPAPDPADSPFEFETDHYKLTVDLDARMAAWPVLEGPKIRTNILNKDPLQNKGSVVKTDGSELTNVDPLTATSEAIRIVKIKVEIYSAGDAYGVAEPLVVMETTKGE